MNDDDMNAFRIKLVLQYIRNENIERLIELELYSHIAEHSFENIEWKNQYLYNRQS